MSNEDTIKFFDYIYPSISRQLDDLQIRLRGCEQHMWRMEEANKELLLTVKQYKNKIQHVEQFLIKHGLIKLLRTNDRY